MHTHRHGHPETCKINKLPVLTDWRNKRSKPLASAWLLDPNEASSDPLPESHVLVAAVVD